MQSVIYTSDSEFATDRLGRELARVLPYGTVVALNGPLGAGKTRLVQAFAEARGVPSGVVTSPTFVLLQHYGKSGGPIHHFDAYRIADEDDFLQLGPEEYFESGAVTFIEWADRVASQLPDDHVRIQIGIKARNSRRFEVTAAGSMFGEAIHRLDRALRKPIGATPGSER